MPMRTSQYRPAVRYDGAVHATDDNHYAIHIGIILKRHLTPLERRNENRWEIARTWLDDHWADYMDAVEEGFIDGNGRFLTREEMWDLLPDKARARSIRRDGDKDWADTTDLYDLRESSIDLQDNETIIPAGTVLYHGTSEHFDVRKPRGGGYDKVFWTTDDKLIARSYIPASGGTAYLQLRQLARGNDYYADSLENDLGYTAAVRKRISRLAWESQVEWTRLQKEADRAKAAANKWVKDNEDASDSPEWQAEFERVFKEWQQAEEAAKNYKMLDVDTLGVKFLTSKLRRMGYSVNSGTVAVKTRLHRIMPASYKLEGQILEVTCGRDFKLYNMASSGDGDLLNPDYHKVGLFAKLEAWGWDGVVINDFAQTDTHGNFGHVSFGFFPRALPDLKVRKLQGQTHPTDADWKKGVGLDETGSYRRMDKLIRELQQAAGITEQVLARDVSREYHELSRHVNRSRLHRKMGQLASLTIRNRDDAVKSIFTTNHALSSPANVYVRYDKQLWIMPRSSWRHLARSIDTALAQGTAPAVEPATRPQPAVTERRAAVTWTDSNFRRHRKVFTESAGGSAMRKARAFAERIKRKDSGNTHGVARGKVQICEIKEDLSVPEPCEDAEFPKISVTKGGIGDAERSYTQFASLGGGSFSPSGPTVENLRPGLYKTAVDMYGKAIFTAYRLNSDSLLRFEDRRYTNVVGEIAKFWELRERYEEIGLIHKRGMLLHGPPGSGKSCLLKLVMEDAVARGNLVLLTDREGLYKISECVAQMRQVEPDRPILVILEDVDDLGEHALLQMFDGDNTAENICYLGTTNYIERLAPRVMRPGRFDVKVEIPPPPITGRQAFLDSKLKPVGYNDEQIVEWAKMTDGFSFGQMRDFIVRVHCFGETAEHAVQTLANGGFINESAVTESTMTLLLG